MGIDLEHPSMEYLRDGDRPHVDVNMVGGGDEENDRDGNMEPDIKNKEFGGDEFNLNPSKKMEPQDGMDFESKEEAFSFYKEYAKSVGFAVLIKASRRSRVSGKFIDAKFVCTRYGNKRESCTANAPDPATNTDSSTVIPVKKKRGRINRSWEKTDCKACMHVKKSQDGRWIICSFVKEHNHEMFPDQAYDFQGRRNLVLESSNVIAPHANRASTKKMYFAMSKQSGGYKKAEQPKGAFTNQLSNTKHLAIDERDAQIMLDHFVFKQDENPYFFYAVDLNEEQRLRNVFWVDAKGRLDYGYFGDVVFFDTTYVKNEYKLPFAPFVGVNHHSQLFFVGCGLIADETRSTYVWLMLAWLKAMGGNAPKVILTDQDEALKEAIAEVFPDSRHCFCLWHIFSKIPEKLSYATRQHENFTMKFNKCVFKSWTAEQFEKRWLKIVDRFSLSNDTWFRSLYEDRERWVPTYMRSIFLAGMSTIQRSEGVTLFLEKYIQRKTTLKEFFEHYKTIVRDKYEEEAKDDFEAWHKQPALKSPSPFGKQMSTMYTHAIFKKFQVEVLGVVACHPKKESENGTIKTFKVQDFEERQDFIVEWNETTSDICCLCRSFEFNGYLCRHVIIVLQMSGKHSIPSQYILKRWTKEAKSRQKGRERSHLESRVQGYNDICRQAFILSDGGSLSQDSYNLAFTALEETLRKCENFNNLMEPGSPSFHVTRRLEEVGQCNSFVNSKKKHNASRRRQADSEPEIITIGMHDSWQQMGHSNLEALALDCSYQSHESLQGMDQLNSRAPTLECYFGSQQIVQGMGQLNSTVSSRDDYLVHQHSMQGLGQLNSIAPIHDSHFISLRMHEMGQLNIKPQAIPGCLELHFGTPQTDQSNEGSTQLHGFSSKHLQPTNLYR